MVVRLSPNLAVMVLLSARTAMGGEAHPEAAFDPREEKYLEASPDGDVGERERAAKDAFSEGLRLLRNGEWRDAELRFRESLAGVRRQSTEYNLAFVLYMQHRRRESLAVLDELSQAKDEGADS